MQNIPPTAGRRVKIGSYNLALPRSQIARIGLGIALIAAGFLGFLPILGFWMIPLGLLVLSVDLPVVRRGRRRTQVWIQKWRNGATARQDGEGSRTRLRVDRESG